jgi:hypothetical protein
MTSQEITRYEEPAQVAPFAQAPLAVQMDYARAVSTANLLPQAYRGKPADIMLAVGLGSAMGLSPAESLYRIDVIQGKPTASAELIAANVRKAGHRLRVRGDDTSCTATIIRSDDPEFEFTVTRDVAWAQAMGLTGKDNYKKQPGTMLQWRAITAVARLACPEALYGVAYTADEMHDQPEQRQGGLAAALGETTAEQVETIKPDEPKPCPVAECPNTAGACPGHPVPMLDPKSSLGRKMFATLGDAGITEKAAHLTYVSDVVGREITTSTELTEDEASRVIDAVQRDLEQPFPEGGASDA